MRRDHSCPVCARPVDDEAPFVLVLGGRRVACCSRACLEEDVRARRNARARTQRRLAIGATAALAVIVGVGSAWRRFHAPPRQALSLEWPEAIEPDAPMARPPSLGPPWPPTDEMWKAVLEGARGTFPLPGPARRATALDERIFGAEPPRDRPPVCREDGRCGVDLGGELWGEHVYAALDGVVERVQGGEDNPRGGHWIRLSHFDGMVFTQYFHLAATPRTLVRGAHVRAGDVIGALGDTGLEGARRRLHFALSIRPSNDLAEVYWDPTPWLARWSLRTPPHGTVAGFVPARLTVPSP